MTIKNKNFFKNLKIKKNNLCFLCGSHTKYLKVLADLPKYPITEFYRKPNSPLLKESNFNQKILFCTKHNHAFVKAILDVNQIYKFYKTSTVSSKGATDCLINLYNYTKKRIRNNILFDLIDIGGNDSTFLNFFNNSKKFKLNIDPNASSKNKKINIKKIFLENIPLKNLRKKNKTIFFSSHTLEHLAKPEDLIKQLSIAMDINDHAILQYPSIEKMVEDKKFEQICHQHINYFSIYSTNVLCKKYKLYIHDYEYDKSHFGTLRVHLKKIKSKIKIPKENLFNKAKINYLEFKNYYKSLNKMLLPEYNDAQGFGAGLMVPILAYYLPVIDKLKVIIDDNQNRCNQKYINLKPIIKSSNFLDSDTPTLITSIATKEASRQIYKKLMQLKIKNITLPAINS